MDINYQTHVQNKGWTKSVGSGCVSGTTGEGLRLEAYIVNFEGIEYTAHIQDKGWIDYVKNGEICGTTGQEKRLEAIKIRLTGESAEKYDVWYRVHAQNKGWMQWTKNDNPSGTAGQELRVEAIQVFVAERDKVILSDTSVSYKKENKPVATVVQQPAVSQAVSKNFAVVSSDGLWYEAGNADDYLTDHIQRSEIMCKCGGRYCNGYFTRISTEVMTCIEGIRNHMSAKYGVDTPVTCSSGLRCPTFNTEEGGISGSLHTTGEACDIYFSGHMYESGILEEIAALANQRGCTAGIYYDQLFVHIQRGYGNPSTHVWG